MAATSSPQATRQIDLFAELHEAPSGKRALSEPVADALVLPTPREGVKESVEALAQQLERTGRYRILRKLEPRRIRENYVLNPGERVGIILDTETTGLDHRRNEIIELGMVGRPLTFVDSKTVENDDVAFAQRRRELGLDVGVEGGSVERPVDDPGRGA